MEERPIKKLHKLSLDNRKNCAVTGVLDVVSFDLNSVILETDNGVLTVKGEDLHVSRLSVERGEVEIYGTINFLAYSESKSLKNTGEGILTRIFK